MGERRAARSYAVAIAAVVWLARMTCGARAWAGSFTPGDIVVYRVGDGVQTLTNNGSPVFIDEYTPAGSFVQAIALPATASGSNRPLLAQGASGTGSAIEGLIATSANGQYVMLTGYSTTVGGAAVLSSTACTGPGGVPRVVGRVKYDGTVDTSTALTDFSCSTNPRAATSSDGTGIWLGGNGSGVLFTTLGSSTSTQLSATTTNVRQVQIFGGQLYAAVNGSAVSTVGTGLPTTGGQTVAALNLPNAGTSPDGFFFATVPGGTVLYLADDTAGTVQKWSLVSGSWIDNGTVAYAGARALFGTVTGSTVKLYLRATAGATIDTLTDSGGFNAALAGTPSALITAPANEVFKGIAAAPVAPGGATPTATVTAPVPTGTGPTAQPTFTPPVPTAPATPTATPGPRTPTPADTAPLPVVDPKAVLGCERSLGGVSTALVTADLAMLERCSMATFKCIQSLPAGGARDACFAKARATCAKAHDGLMAARGGFEATLNASCGGSPARVPLSLLRAGSVLGFDSLEPSCQQYAGVSLNSLGAISSCVQAATTCRAERALALAVPRLADLLAPVLDTAGSGMCIPPPTGDLDGLGDATEAKRALRCQAAAAAGARGFVLRRLRLTQKCVDSMLRCRVTGQPTGRCAQIAATCDKQLGALSTGSRGTTAKLAGKIARACGPLAPASLLDADGPGFAASTARCNAFGGGPFGVLAAPRGCIATTKRSCLADAVGTCIANAFDCAATAIVSEALPLAADELGRFDVQLSENPYCADDPNWTRDALEPSNLLDVALRDIHPTQAVLGFDEIYYKLGRYRGTKDEAGGGHNHRFDDWCEANGQIEAVSAQPGARLSDPATFSCALAIGAETPDSLNLMKTVVIGPGGQLYLEDGHHTFTEFWEQPDGGPDMHIRVRVVGNLSHLDRGAFWREMQLENRVWLLDGNNLPITVNDLPQSLGLASFQNDTYRGLVYFTRDIGYAVPVTQPEYLEFLWGEWLRQRLDVSAFNLTDLQSYLALVETASMEMTDLTDIQPVRNGQTAGQLGRLQAWNAGLPATAGEFAKLSKPITASKPGKVAYAVDYKASLAP